MTQKFDIVILGSGFGGSLLSTILVKSGMSVALVDRSQHPRFAIGESSTPLANSTLDAIADEFEISELKPFAQYGTWTQAHPEITCGLKRGFSYFHHTAFEEMNVNEMLLVAASKSNNDSDAHWLRSDVDAFFFELAEFHGVKTFENARYKLQQDDRGWKIDGHVPDQKFRITTDFVVDATGSPNEVPRVLCVRDTSSRLSTDSLAVFAHFKDVVPVCELLQDANADMTSHPYPCDAAAVHHVLDNGWMWQLRFDDDTVSAGFLLKGHNYDRGIFDANSSDEIWSHTLQRFPTLEKQFINATIVRPESGLRRTRRLQRLFASAAGMNWAALPSTVGFVDPLHSTGIAHTLFAVRRLARILTAKQLKSVRHQQLESYSIRVIEEIQLVDELVEGCYAALPDFRLWSAWCMMYFVAVTSMEQTSTAKHDVSFLRADDLEYRHALRAARQQLGVAVRDATRNATTTFEDWLRSAIQPWNQVGLLDNSVKGMYSATAAPRRK